MMAPRSDEVTDAISMSSSSSSSLHNHLRTQTDPNQLQNDPVDTEPSPPSFIQRNQLEPNPITTTSIPELNSLFPSGDFETWPTCKIYTGQALAALTSNPRDDLPTLELLVKVVRYLISTSQISDASPLSGKMVSMAQTVLDGGLGHLHCEALHQAATLKLILGQYGEAEPLIRATLQREGEDVLSVQCQICLGNILLRQLRRSESKSVFAGAVEAAKRVLGTNHETTLRAMCSLARALSSPETLPESDTMLRTAYEGQKLIFEPGHPHLITTKMAICHNLLSESRFEEGSVMIEEIIQECNSSLGPRHLQTLYASACHAQCLQLLGRNKEFSDVAARNHEEMKNLLGPTHPGTLRALQVKASAARIMGQYDEAVELQRLAYQTEVRANGERHPRTLSTLDDLGVALCRAGRPDEAIELHRRALQGLQARQIQENRLVSVDIIDCQTNLAIALSKTGHNNEAESMLVDALDNAREALGPANHRTLRIASTIGTHWCYSANRYQDAVELLQENIRLRTESLGAESPDNYADLRVVAQCQRMVGRFDDAIILFERAFAAFAKRFGDNHPVTVACLRHLNETKFERLQDLSSSPLRPRSRRLTF